MVSYIEFSKFDPYNTNHAQILNLYMGLKQLLLCALTVEMKPAGQREQQVNDSSSIDMHVCEIIKQNEKDLPEESCKYSVLQSS